MNNRFQNMQDSCCHKGGSPVCGESMVCDPLQTMPLAMAYVPWQQWQNVYEGSKGLENGTIFEELIFPFQHGSRVCNGGNNGCGSMNSRRGDRERFGMEQNSMERYGNKKCRNERMEHCERNERCEKGNRCEQMGRCEKNERCEQMGRCEKGNRCEQMGRCDKNERCERMERCGKMNRCERRCD